MQKFSRFLFIFIMIIATMSCRTLTGGFSTPVAVPNPTEQLPEQTSVPTAAAARLPQLEGDWKISFVQSGGLIGVSRSLEILSNGNVTATDLRTNKIISSQLGSDKLAALIKLVATSKYTAVTLPSGCADCFIFDLKISSGAEEFTVELDQVSLPDSGLEPLFEFLAEYLKGL